MNKYIIGLPKALLFHKYYYLWKTFFEELGFEVIISHNSNKSIIKTGINYSIDESCLAMKIFLGHIDFLKDKCDYILIPRLESIKKGEKLCTNFNCLYDLIRVTFPNIDILNYNVDVDNHINEIDGFIDMAYELKANKIKAIKAYHKAKKILDKYNQEKIDYQNKQLEKSNSKILLVGHNYILNDEMLGLPIIKYLEQNNITVLTSDKYNDYNLEKEVKTISKEIYWTYNKELLGAAAHYKNQVDGMIILTAFPCGPDSLTSELIMRKINIPTLNIILDEQTENTGLITRLESFIDIIERKKTHESKENNQFSSSR